MVPDVLAPRNLELGPLGRAAHAGLAPAAAEAAEASPWRHWRLARDDAAIAWLVIDKAGSSANTLSEEVLTELDDVLARLEREPPKGLVLRSAKTSGFIAGADIGEFGPLAGAAPPEASAAPFPAGGEAAGGGQASERAGADPIEAKLTQANAVIDRLDRLPFATVAVIHGYCLGGGLEIALACDYRIAVEEARLGFPEVMLGVHPGLGGTARLTRLINPIEAMTMMLTGRNVRATRARSLGLVDAVVPERHVAAAAAAAVAGQLKGRRSPLGIALLNTMPSRRLAARRMRTETAKRAPAAHYPAPHALIDIWEAHGGSARDLHKAEIASFARLLRTDTSRNLVRAFFLREKLKSMTDGDFAGRRVHVIGAGTMGGDIAAWCAWHGFVVTLADMQAEPLARAVARAWDLYGKIGHKRTDSRDALDRLIPDLEGEGVRSADLVIEAVPETLELKRKVFAAIEQRMKPGAILATNTSSITLEELRAGLQHPDRLVGLHFFNPVSRMQLVEVVSHDQIAADVPARARAFLGRIDRLPAPVKSAPGFLVNRALTPYMLEAMMLLHEGVKRETIDAAAVQFGMPMGPIELADTVGLDICLHVAQTLAASLERSLPEPTQTLHDKVAAGELGRKTGKGLYEWKNGEPLKDPEAPPPSPEMTDRLILPMLDVCMTCLREGIVADEDTIDGAMIFATGFAPFRGGPMRYARSRGVTEIRQTLWQFSQRYGERFRPDPGWNE
ncbi:MAG TPA: 3-hydroxyacyl-CoA dehydrogenase NAD-binding domain-containing protein [Xanthobacteraceae bacterium]|jgi:3-hydroxyacyl-CoA dehydrogenase/enoyl-CoA hydratase/3-hydroxybutyryl-CoA epimerase